MDYSSDESDYEDDVSKVDPNILWQVYTVSKCGSVVMLTEVFYSNIWPDFWSNVNSAYKIQFTKKIIDFLNSNKSNGMSCPDDWREEVADILSTCLNWNTSFFMAFPWNWMYLNPTTVWNMMNHHLRSNQLSIHPSVWLKQELTQDDSKISDDFLKLEVKALESMYISKNIKFTRTDLNIDESSLSVQEIYRLRWLKLEYNAISSKEIPSMLLFNVVKETMSFLSLHNELKPEDKAFEFALGCSSERNSMWNAIMRYKGFVGEEVFTHLYGDIYDSLPEEIKMKDGRIIIPSTSAFEQTSESRKPSIKEIICDVANKTGAIVSWPGNVPLYFPDFYSVYQENQEFNKIDVTIFENTWSVRESKKTFNDRLKWEKFVKDFNDLTSELVEKDYTDHKQKFIMLHVIPVNITEYEFKKQMNMCIQRRIDMVTKLTSLFNQRILSHDNKSVKETIDACNTIRVPKKTPRNFFIPKDVLDELTDLVNEDVEKDTKVPDYIDKLEEPMTKERIELIEEELITEIHAKLNSDEYKNQNKWVLTNQTRLYDGIAHISNNLFNKQRLMRLVQNNHHDSTQFENLNLEEDISGMVDSFFSKISDLLESLKGREMSKLKPQLCILVHIAAGHKNYLANNGQFGSVEGMDIKSSRFSKLVKFLRQKFPDDMRVASINNVRAKKIKKQKILIIQKIEESSGDTFKGKLSSNLNDQEDIINEKSAETIWAVGDYNLSDYKNHVDPVLSSLVRKKKNIDFVHRFTKEENSNLINSFNKFNTEEMCCSHQVMRFDHETNNLFITCPEHETRYYYPNPFADFDVFVDEAWTGGMHNAKTLLCDYLDKPEADEFADSFILHFLSGCLKEKEIKFIIPQYFFSCTKFHQQEIIKTLTKRNLSQATVDYLNDSGIPVQPKTDKTKNDLFKERAAEIIKSWYTSDLKYIKDPISRDHLHKEFDALIETNSFSVCIAEMAEQFAKIRGQSAIIQNCSGYVIFNKSFGPIYSSPAKPDSEAITCFSLSDGYFYLNNRTIRMLQGIPMMLLANKQIIDKMKGRQCEPGNYKDNSLLNFCMLNSRRLNVNLQNLRYFFMACWSQVHSPFMFKKLEMDFLKTSELNVCLELLKYMRDVLKNYKYLHPEEDQCKKIKAKSNFRLLFSEDVNIDLNDTDLCLHSFYEVHLFERTISGKVQEIKKVFKKFLKPKQAWFTDKQKYLKNQLTVLESNRFLMSDGLNDNLKSNIEMCFQEVIEHKKRYAGFDLSFIKCAASKFTGFNKNEFAAEIRCPDSISDLIKSTSTVKKFDKTCDFQKICEAVELKASVEKAMKQLEKDAIKHLTEKLCSKLEQTTLFPKCVNAVTHVKHQKANDLDDEEVARVTEVVSKVDEENLTAEDFEKLDEALSKTSFIQISENFEHDKHHLRNKSEIIKNLKSMYFGEFVKFNALLEEYPVINLMLSYESLKADIDKIRTSVTKYHTAIKLKEVTANSRDLEEAYLIVSYKNFKKKKESFKEYALETIHKERTPSIMKLKQKIRNSLNFIANTRDMTTKLVIDVLNLMNSEYFSDIYSVCNHFKFNCDPIVFGMAFKEQFGGERELTIADIWGKLTLKLVEDIARKLGKCMVNTCLNEPSNEDTFKDYVIATQKSNQLCFETSETGKSSNYLYGSIDRSSWGPYHQGLAFYVVIRILLLDCGLENQDVVDIVKYSLFKHALKEFEIHHNIIVSTVTKMRRKGVLFKDDGKWCFDMEKDVRPDILIENWETFVFDSILKGEKSIHTRMDMGQGMLHSCSDVYGAVIDNYIKHILEMYMKRFHNLSTEIRTMNTSDDSSSVSRLSGEGDGTGYLELFLMMIFITDLLQRLANMYISEKSVWSYSINEFKSSFMRNGVQIRVLVKFLSTQLTFGKDCLPEDYWNTYNSLTKQILCNGGSQMMCDTLYLAKLHLLKSCYTLSKSPFEDCIVDAPISRFGFPNLTAVDVYYHTSRHLMANQAIKSLGDLGIKNRTLRLRVIEEPFSGKDELSQERNEFFFSGIQQFKDDCCFLNEALYEEMSSSKCEDDKIKEDMGNLEKESVSSGFDSSMTESDSSSVSVESNNQKKKRKYGKKARKGKASPGETGAQNLPTSKSTSKTKSQNNLSTASQEVIIMRTFTIKSKDILPPMFVSSSGALVRNIKLNDGSMLVIRLPRSTVNIYIKTHRPLTLDTLESCYIKFFTLSKSVGVNETESICCGVGTLLPSSRGKLNRDEEIKSERLSEMSTSDFFTMTQLPNTKRSAELKGTQAYVQTNRLMAKRNHPNLVFVKGLLINKGEFCYLNEKLVTQKIAFRNFDDTNEEFKDIRNIVYSLHHSYKPIKKMIDRCMNSNCDISIELRNTMVKHESASIRFYTDQDHSLMYDPLLVRAVMRAQLKSEGQLIQGRLFDSTDALIIKYSEYDVLDMDLDVCKFKQYYLDFTDHELMMVSMNKQKKILSGVYMFESSEDTNEQVAFILQGAIHNFVKREVQVDTSPVLSTKINLPAIHKLLVTVSILVGQCDNQSELKSRLSAAVLNTDDLKRALIDGMLDIRYTKICAVLNLLINPNNTHAERTLLRHFRFLKNLEESGDNQMRNIRGQVRDIPFHLEINLLDQFNAQLKVAPCDDKRKKGLLNDIREFFELRNHSLTVEVDHNLKFDASTIKSEDNHIRIEYKDSKFVICLTGDNSERYHSFFSDINFHPETWEYNQEASKKWFNCVELTCNTPVITDTSVLWDLIKSDVRLAETIDKSDFGLLSLDEYRLQFSRLEEIMNYSKRGNNKPKDRTKIIATLLSKPFNHTVIKDYCLRSGDDILKTCPDSITERTSPFTQVFMLCKLMIKASKFEQVFTPDNVMKVLTSESGKFKEIPSLKFKGMPVTHIAKVESGSRPKFLTIRDHKSVLDSHGDDILNEGDLQDEFGVKFRKKTVLFFSPGVSIRSLFSFKQGNNGVRVILADIYDKKVIHWDLEDYSNNAEIMDDIVGHDFRKRLGMIIPDSDTGSGSVKLEL